MIRRPPDRTHTHPDYAAKMHSHPELNKEFLARSHTHDNTFSAGTGAVPSLIANQQTTVQVTLRAAMADTDYEAVAVLIGGVSLLAALSIVSTTVVSATRVDVVVRNTGLITLAGATVLVQALKNVPGVV